MLLVAKRLLVVLGMAFLSGCGTLGTPASKPESIGALNLEKEYYDDSALPLEDLVKAWHGPVRPSGT